MKRFLRLAAVVAAAAAIVWLIHYQLQPDQPPKTSGALEALNMWGTQRAYPGEQFPVTGYYQAFLQSRQLFGEGLSKLQADDVWEPIGPFNIGGRTLAIAFNPLNSNTVYAGTASGGLWRSYTGGDGVEAWEQVMTGEPVLGVSSIAIVPDDSNTIYIGSGEVHNYQFTGMDPAIRITRGSYGFGILKTTDGGVTWEKSLDWTYQQERGVWAVRINPLNFNTLWAGTTEGVYRSQDAGETWEQMSDQLMIMDLEINPVDTTIIYATSGNLDFPDTRGIYRSTDTGQTWDELTNGVVDNFGGKAMVTLAPSDPDVVYLGIGNGYWSGAGTWLYRSDDGGDSWVLKTTQDYSTWQGWYSHDIAVFPDDPDHIIAIGIETWESFNGGSTLSRIASSGGAFFGRVPVGGPEGPDGYVHADQHAVVLHPEDPDIIYIGCDGGVFRSLDGGDTWAGKNGGFRCTQFYAGFASSHTDSLLSIGGMQDNFTAIYDGDPAWIRVIGGDGGWAAIDATNSNTLYGSWQGLNILKSTNGGASFFGLTPPNDGNTIFIAPYVVSVNNPQVIYAGRGHIYKSSNGGSSWTTTNNGAELDGNPALSMAVSWYDTNVAYVTTAPFFSPGSVFRTVNGGASWQEITGDLPDRFYNEIAVDPTDHSILYVALSGFGSPHLYRSDDWGDNWTPIDTDLPDVPASALAVDPDFPNHLYFGNDLGVYFSENLGETWESFQEGLPDAVITMDLSISPLDRSLRIATHGNGIYQRSLVGDLTGIEEPAPVAMRFNLAPNYPNPFNPSTTITFDIAKTGPVTLRVFDLQGRLVRTLIEQSLPAGTHEIRFDGSNLASGVYFYRLEVGDYVKSRKMTLTR